MRYTWKASQTTTPAYALTRFTFTGQYSHMDDPSTGGVTEGFGLMFYNARWYDPYLNHMTQPDSIVPDPYNSQDYDRYSYVRNNPLKYTDPSGHRCKGSDGHYEDDNSWGYCGDQLPTPQNVKVKDRARYIRDVARKYNIHLAPGDHWDYIDYADVGQGETLGWTPDHENQEYDDQNGDSQFSSDIPVYMTDRGFRSCHSDTCLAGIMAHEATHSWIEFKIEQTSPTNNPRMSNYVYAEEMAADVVAITQIGDAEGYLNNHFYSSNEDCEGIFGKGNCSNPIQMIEDYYLIDLSNLSSQIFGR